MSPKWLLSCLSLAIVVPALALPVRQEGFGVRGGGDEIALEFFMSAQKAIEDVGVLDAEMAAVFKRLRVTDSLSAMSVVVVTYPLFVATDEERQESIAVNEPSASRVLVNRARWRDLSDERIRRAIALHEVLSLAGLESTGDYGYTKRYLGRLGLSRMSLQPSGLGFVSYVDCVNPTLASLQARVGFDRTLSVEARALSKTAMDFMTQVATSAGLNPRWPIVALSYKVPLIQGGVVPCSFDPFDRRIFDCSLNESPLRVRFEDALKNRSEVEIAGADFWSPGVTAAGRMVGLSFGPLPRRTHVSWVFSGSSCY